MDSIHHTQPTRENAPERLARHSYEWIHRAGQLAGFLYLAGDIAFMAHAKTINNGGIDKLKMTRGLAYLVGSLILLCCTDNSKNSDYMTRQRRALRHKLDKDMQDAGLSKKDSQQIESWIKRELKEHPWELAYLLFVVGSAMQGASAVNQKRYTEAAATLGTITSILIPVVIPEGNQKPFIKLSDNMETQGHHFAQSYHHIKQAMPILKPIFDMSDAVMHQVRHHPLRVSAGIAILSNGMYGLQALQQQPVEKGLAAMSGLYLGANVATSFASKNMSRDHNWDKTADTLHEQMDQESTPHHPVYSL